MPHLQSNALASSSFVHVHPLLVITTEPLTKVIFPEAIKSLGSGSFLHKPQMKVLLQTKCSREHVPEFEGQMCMPQTILLSLMGSTSHTSILRVQGMTHAIHKKFSTFCWSCHYLSSNLISSSNPPCWPGTHQMSISHTPTHHTFLLILFDLLNLPCFIYLLKH